MPLNGNVLISESALAARIGATLFGAVYTIFGLTMTQTELESIINNQVGEEMGVVGNAVYTTSNAEQAGLMQAYQMVDCAYAILSGLAGRASTYFNFRTGDQSFELQIGFLQEETARYEKERNRLVNLIQNITPSDTTTDVIQPGYSSVPSSLY